jgi:hypothetical protein
MGACSFDVVSKHKAGGKPSKLKKGKYFYLDQGENID